MSEPTKTETTPYDSADVPVESGEHIRRAPLVRRMPGASGTRDFWRYTLKERKYLLICFFLPALLMWLTYITMKVYPFGEESVLVLDLNGQYVYYFEALRDIIHGGGSLLYSFCRALGGEFLGIIGYYIASPFSIITAIFPDSMMTEALLVMFLLKTGLCGLTFGIYADATRKIRNRPATVIFSTLYALSAYAVVMQHNTMWIDNLIWLPLILLGIENLIKHGKFRMYVITLSLAVFSNFYIGYMMCIFCVLYFFFYYYSIPAAERNPKGVKLHLPRTLVKFGLFTLLAVAICAVTVWGSYYSLTFGKTDFSDPNFSLTQRFDFLDFASKMYFGSYDTVRPEGWPFVYCGMLTLILLPLYFFAKKVTLREKIARVFLCLAVILSFNLNPVDMAWHGFQKPNWLNYRYSFMLVFLFLIMAYKAFDEIKDIGYRAVFASSAVAAGVLFVLQKLDYENLPDLRGVWVSFILIVAYLLLLRASTMNKPSLQKTAALVMCIFVSFEAYASALVNLIALDNDVVYSSRTGYRDFIDKYQPVADWMYAYDGSFYRAEKTYHRKTNDNMALGLHGVSNSTSTLNAKIIKLLARYGIASRSHWSKYLGSTEVFDSIFGIKYVLSPEPGTTSEMYEKIGVVNDVGIYYNPYAMSVAAGVSEDICSADLTPDSSKYDSPFELMNATVTAMLGETETVELFKPIAHDDIVSTDASTSTVSGHRKYTANSDNASVSISFTAPGGEDVLMYIPSDYARECDMYVNSVKKDTYFGNETCRIVNLGKFEEGQLVTVRLELNKDNLYIKNTGYYFYTLDRELFTQTAPKLNSNPFRIDEYSDDCLCGTIVVTPGKELIYTSIPYDEGWHVTANGKEIETFEILGGLMAFKLDVGSYNLKLDYMPKCVVYGSIISLSALALFVVLCVVDSILRKTRRRKEALAEYERISPDVDDSLHLAELTVEESGGIANAAALSNTRSISTVLTRVSDDSPDETDETISGGTLENAPDPKGGENTASAGDGKKYPLPDFSVLDKVTSANSEDFTPSTIHPSDISGDLKDAVREVSSENTEDFTPISSHAAQISADTAEKMKDFKAQDAESFEPYRPEVTNEDENGSDDPKKGGDAR